MDNAANPHQEGTAKPITGYRKMTDAEVDQINLIKGQGEELAEMIKQLEEMPATDKRWVAIAKTHLQMGIMFAVRAVARPTSF
jgi:hypothetical protein